VLSGYSILYCIDRFLPHLDRGEYGYPTIFDKPLSEIIPGMALHGNTIFYRGSKAVIKKILYPYKF
jgi:hypothetical protein